LGSNSSIFLIKSFALLLKKLGILYYPASIFLYNFEVFGS